MTTIDRTGWPSGPWDREPDREEWIDPVTGYFCLAQRSTNGTWSAYVSVPVGHPLFEVMRRDAPDAAHAAVHCDLTFEGPLRARPDEWAFGFDCNHLGDQQPDGRNVDPLVVYRPLPFVRDCVTALAAALQVKP